MNDDASPPENTAAAGVVPAPGLLLGLAGLALTGVAIGQEWAVEAVWGESRSAANFTVQSLWDDIPADFDGPSIMWPLLVVILVGVVSLFKGRFVAGVTVAGIAGMVVPLMFVRTVKTALEDPYFDGLAFSDAVGSGVWMCLAGGVVTTIAGILLLVLRARSRS